MSVKSQPSSAPIQPGSAQHLPEPLQSWSGARTEYPRDKTVAALFEEVAAQHPDAIALVCENVQLAYQELNLRANRLAHRLRRKGVGPETLVGCWMDRSAELIVALLAILKAGGAYVPLDPAYPKTRLDFLLHDTQAPLVLTRGSAAALPCRKVEFLSVDKDDSVLSPADAENPAPAGGPASLAYVMYTSGSTGRPKGVLIENRGIVRLVRNTNYCRFGPDEVFLQFAPVSFDASTFEIWGALLNGGRLVIMPPHASSLDDLGAAIRQHQVTTLWLTAGFFHLMVEQRVHDLKSLRQLLAGGDVLSPHHVRLFLDAAPNTSLINGYGPTENTSFTCCHVMRKSDSLPEPIPIGKPISNTQVYILDEQMQPVRPGESGELCTGGDGVARGYLNDPEATAAKFLPNPFAHDSQQRLYRTGDLARWRTDGTIEFLGRLDDQVKILGHRIEPGEIESLLMQNENVKQACVVPRIDTKGGKRLAAYFVPRASSSVTPEMLKDFVASRLPQHMIPASFVPLDSLPLSAHGKVDRQALAKLEIPAGHEPHQQNRAGTHLERTIADLWQRVLNVPQVGLDDNFFDLGGDSLLLVAVHSNLQKILQTEIPLTDLFEFATVRKLARHLGEGASGSPVFSEVQRRAQRQRQAFTRLRESRAAVDCESQ